VLRVLKGKNTKTPFSIFSKIWCPMHYGNKEKGKSLTGIT
jgi:hypothetical protein